MYILYKLLHCKLVCKLSNNKIFGRQLTINKVWHFQISKVVAESDWEVKAYLYLTSEMCDQFINSFHVYSRFAFLCGMLINFGSISI